MAQNRYYSATAQDTTLTSAMTNSATTMVVGSTVGYPSSFPYALAVDYNSSAEELVLVTAVSGYTLTVTRGFNGTTAQAHASGAVVRHVITAQDMTDAGAHIGSGPGGVHGITGSVGTFLATPTSANLAAAVTDETGTGALVFGTAPIIAMGINVQTGPSYTLVAADAAKLVTLYNTGGITLTIPAATFSVGQAINIQQTGAGQVTVQGDGTATFTGTGTKLRTQYSAATILCTATNVFTLIGDIQ